MNPLVALITSQDPAVRNQSVDACCRGWSLDRLIQESVALDSFRRTSENLYERVRALAFLAAIFRYRTQRMQKQFGGHEVDMSDCPQLFTSGESVA